MIATIASSGPLLRVGLLAAGFSSRLGEPKALARVHGSSLLARTLGLLSPLAGASKIIVVVPPGARLYRLGPHARAATFVVNSQRAAGLSSSVKSAIRSARYSAAILLLPVDLVDLERRDLARLIARWRGTRRSAVARRVQARPATPLILPRGLYGQALEIEGDQGLRELVRGLPALRVSLVDLPSAEADIDTPQDLARARRRFRPGRRREQLSERLRRP